MSCSLNPAAWQAIRTPELCLEQGSFALQSAGSRISKRDNCAESKSSKRFRGVSSADDDAPGSDWGNERKNEFVMLLHIPLARCAPSPNPLFPPYPTLSSSPNSPPFLPFPLFCLKFNKAWNSGGLKRASGVFWLGFMSHAGAM